MTNNTDRTLECDGVHVIRRIHNRRLTGWIVASVLIVAFGWQIYFGIQDQHLVIPHVIGLIAMCRWLYLFNGAMFNVFHNLRGGACTEQALSPWQYNLLADDQKRAYQAVHLIPPQYDRESVVRSLVRMRDVNVNYVPIFAAIGGIYYGAAHYHICALWALATLAIVHISCDEYMYLHLCDKNNRYTFYEKK